ncbi:hypothetical protein HPP92_006433 [Vanilla planifolia]|uniref:Uncharacterized protein n=1 Tax=Vanilla planifolia TaxID=51239 RepID=A0A835RJW3_VANPL|nr:hypothetical protein HPP92_006433 [Vanilla planifolia]
MEPRRQSKNGFSYSNLFNLEALMDYQLSRPDDDAENYGTSSQDESHSSQGQVNMLERSNGVVRDKNSNTKRKQNKNAFDPEDGLNSFTRKETELYDEDGESGTVISDEQYRSMLSEHVQKYRRLKLKDSSSRLASAQVAVPIPRRNQGLKGEIM